MEPSPVPAFVKKPGQPSITSQANNRIFRMEARLPVIRRKKEAARRERRYDDAQLKKIRSLSEGEWE